MRLDGALKPRGASILGRSIGAKGNRNKRSEHLPSEQGSISNELQPKIVSNPNQLLSVHLTNIQDSNHNNNKNNRVIMKSKIKKLQDLNVRDSYKLHEEEDEEMDDSERNQRPKTKSINNLAIEEKNPENGVDKIINKMAVNMVNSGIIATKSIDNLAKLVRVQQFLATVFSSANCGLTFVRRLRSTSCFSLTTFALCLIYVLILLPNKVTCDDNDNGFFVNTFSITPETTTPEFDYASRGKKKFGDKCDNTLECGFPGSICDPKKKSCQCTEDLPITNHIDKCGKEAAVNESCFFNEQCESFYFQTECRDGRCICRFEMTPIIGKDGVFECKGRGEKPGPGTYIDPAMIGVLVGMALMFIIICVVLRLFSQARWRENRTIFNTPNPRLMNVSLLRDSKLLHGQERRGSRMSVRAPSRQPSMASLRPHSPNPSLGRMTRSKSNTRSSDSRTSDASNCSRLLEHAHAHGHSAGTTSSTAAAAAASTYVTSPGSRTGSHGSGSNASATSVRSTRSNSVAPGHVTNISNHHERKGSAPHHHQHHHQQQQQQQQSQPLITNITPNLVADSITVEIIKQEK